MAIAATFTCGPASGQIYTFQSGPSGDGFVWPASPTGLVPDESYTTPDGIDIYNGTGNNLFFDGQFQGAGNAAQFSGGNAAMWSNPTGDFAFVEFYVAAQEMVTSFSFDISLIGAPANGPTLGELYVEAYDYDSGESGFVAYSLSELFDAGPVFSNQEGYSETVSFSVEDFYRYDEELEDDVPFGSFESFLIDLSEISHPGGGGEFALDNLAFNGSGVGPGEVYPSVNGGSDNASGATISGSVQKGSGPYSVGVEVTNGGGEFATFSTTLEPGHTLDDLGQVVDQTIGPGESTYTPGILGIDTDASLSGTYEALVNIINGSNPSDPDDQFTQRVRLHDPAQPSDNSGGDPVSAGEQLTISNAANLGHADASRAAIQLGEGTVSGPFSVSQFSGTTAGFFGNEYLEAGNTATADVVFTSGLVSGTYVGTYLLELDAVSQQGFFLANADELAPVAWNLTFTHDDNLQAAKLFAADAPFANQLAINNLQTAAKLAGGQSSVEQTVTLQFGTNPEPLGATADILGDVVDLSFTAPGDQYVLQLAYVDGNVPSGADESDLELLYFDTAANSWSNAVLGNSDNGNGQQQFTGSYDDFLASLAGSPVPLSAYGIDTAANTVWAVLDFAAEFAVGGLFQGSLEGDYDGSGAVEQADLDLVLLNWGSPASSVPASWINDLAQGDIDQDELDGVLLNWGNSSPFATQSVPEPGMGTLAFLAVLGGRLVCGWGGRRGARVSPRVFRRWLKSAER